MALSCSKELSSLLRSRTSKHDSDFYHFSYLFSLRTKDNLKSHKKVCKLKDFCGVVMASEGTETLEFNQYRKSEATPYIIYADLEALKIILKIIYSKRI